MSKDLDQEHNAESETGAPPDKAASGDVSTIGHSSHEADAHNAGSHDDRGGHGDDTSDEPTLVPTKVTQLVLPAIILVIVAILVAAPILNAFSPQPASAPVATESSSTEENHPSEGENTVASTATPARNESQASPTSVPSVATQPPSPTTGAGGASIEEDLPLMATQTAVAALGEQGEVARVPVRLEFGGTSFEVAKGSGLMPDWTPSQDTGTATWIQGTVANHILYVPYDEKNAALFKASKPGDTIKVEMNTGKVFTFVINLAQRATNGPATHEGQFTVNVAMSQDHAGVTLFLIGDPATDRAVVQADFTGSIQ